MSLAGTALTPSLVIACIVPILYWRGHLVQRFLISVVIAITVLNIVGNLDFFSRNQFAATWRELAMVAACWIALPVLFLWTPIKTRYLRLIVASGVMLLTLCLSVLHMYEAQPNDFFLGWMSLYAAAFSFALLRRNWGRIAMVEAATQAEDIETTSTRTLLELMVVSGLACSAASFWATRVDMSSAVLFGTAALFGLIMACVSMVLIRFTFEAGVHRVPKLLIVWVVVAFAFYANVLTVMLIDLSRYGTTFFQSQPLVIVSNVSLVGAIVTSLVYMLLTFVIGYWLRWCGWRIERAPAAVVTDVRSFSEMD